MSDKSTAEVVRDTIATGLEGVREDIQKDILAKFEEMDQKARDHVEGLFKDQKAELDERAEKTDQWISEVEKASNKARFGNGGDGIQDALKAFVSEKHPKTLGLYASKANYSTGAKADDVVENAALEVWLKNAAKMQVARYSRFHQRLAEENEQIEKILGRDVFHKAAMQEDSDTEGGYLVPSPLEARVLRQIEDANVVRRLATTLRMTSKTLDIPDLASNITAYITAEEGSITQSEPTFNNKQLVAKKIAAYGIASEELVSDSSIGLLDFYLTIAAEKIGLLEEDQALEGDGTGVNFTGLVAASGVNEVQADGAGSAGAEPTYSLLTQVVYKAAKRSTRRGAAWFMNPAQVQKVVALTDSNGAPLLNRMDTAKALTLFLDRGLPGEVEGTMLGFPVYASDEISITRTVGMDTDCSNHYFGPFRSLIFGDRMGISFAVSEHVAFQTVQLAMRVIKRTGIVVGVPADFTKLTGVLTDPV